MYLCLFRRTFLGVPEQQRDHFQAQRPAGTPTKQASFWLGLGSELEFRVRGGGRRREKKCGVQVSRQKKTYPVERALLYSKTSEYVRLNGQICGSWEK